MHEQFLCKWALLMETVRTGDEQLRHGPHARIGTLQRPFRVLPFMTCFGKLSAQFTDIGLRR